MIWMNMKNSLIRSLLWISEREVHIKMGSFRNIGLSMDTGEIWLIGWLKRESFLRFAKCGIFEGWLRGDFCERSHPVWVRELKYRRLQEIASKRLSHPVWVRKLKLVDS